MVQLSTTFPHELTGTIQLGPTEFEPLLDSAQAASLLRVHPKTLQKIARRGEIHGTRVGKLWRFRASDLNAWISRQERAS
jgi:excisionase family DNA binding protein